MSLTIKKLMPRNLARKMMNQLSFLPDSVYLKLFYFATTGRTLDLKNPRLFSEKQQWLKLNDIHPEYKVLVDKLTVNGVIDEKLGEGYCFPILGYWKCFDDIDFDCLPKRFVLKCNHDSGSTKVILDKGELTKKDIDELKKFFDSRVKKDFFYAGREYPYKGIDGYIIAQKYMADDNIHPNSGKEIKKPDNFDKMKRIAKTLSEGMKFVRIDLYEINRKIYFGEYTFFHGGGFCLFYPIEWEKKLGDWLNLE